MLNDYIDKKIDDGLPDKGRIYGLNGQEPSDIAGPCTQPAVACVSGTDYDIGNVTSSTPRCRMVIYLIN